MEIRREQGKRGARPESDQKIYVRTNGWELFGYESQLTDLLTAFFENEDAIFPPEEGYDGRKYLRWYINVLANEGPEAAKRKNQDRKERAQQRRLFDWPHDGGESDNDV